MLKALALSLALLLCSLPARARDELVIGISQFPASLNPVTDSMLAKSYVLGFAFRPLTAYDSGWRLICMLCETLPSLENGLARLERLEDGGQGIAVTYTIRAGASWADGVPVSSEDVVFSWELGRHPQSGVVSGEIHRRIRRVEVKDARSFTLHLDRVTFDYNSMGEFQILPAHLERPRFEAAPAEYRNRSAFVQDATNPGLYNGPYRIAAITQGSHLVLEANAHWKGGRPQFRRIIIRAIENSAALETSLLAGGIHMIAGETGLQLEQALALERRPSHAARFHIVTRPSLAYLHLDLNLDNPILADRRVRRALLLGLDRQAIGHHLYEDRQPVAASLVPPLDWVFAAHLAPAAFDPDQAARLLEEAGWRPGPDGWRRNDKGERLSLELLTTAGNRSRELLSQVMQAQWKRIGVELRLRLEPPRVLFGDTLTRRRFPHMALFTWYSSPESVPRSTLASDMIPKAENNWSGQNYPGYASAEMDGLITRIEVELEPGLRKELWHRLQEVYAQDLPALPLFFKADPFVLPRGFSGLDPTGHQDSSSLWVERWRWE